MSAAKGQKNILITKKCSCSAVVAAEQLEFVIRDKPLNMNVVGEHTHIHTHEHKQVNRICAELVGGMSSCDYSALLICLTFHSDGSPE